MSTEDDNAINEINDSSLLESFEKMTTEEDKVVNETNEPLLKKLLSEMPLWDTNFLSSLLESFNKVDTEEINAANEIIDFEKIYENSYYEIDIYKELKYKQNYGLCPECNQPNTSENWCEECNSKRFQQNFDGLINHWDYEKQDWERITNELDEQNYEDANNDTEIKNPLKSSEKYGYRIVLKSLNNSSKNDENFKKFLDEWKSHIKYQYKVVSNGSLLVPVHGITQDPDTKNYMVAMLYIPSGSLRNNLPIIKSNPNDNKYSILYYISVQLEGIHKLGFVHGDFHSGNVLYLPNDTIFMNKFSIFVNQYQS
ncbi:kinase-like domain-containing protein [Rhizophagus clarus]|uniref:Kinase-like domain-containing protein n=1 Tax=Rhizophagus clarus TaxID=94130 RepID=A0A8H3KZQ9_9GLOM|nr:kinase-like domain-containing protein [Rhizophagus clarus]